MCLGVSFLHFTLIFMWFYNIQSLGFMMCMSVEPFVVYFLPCVVVSLATADKLPETNKDWT